MRITLRPILLLSAVLAYGQMSHSDLTRDLVSDLRENISVSTGVGTDSLYLKLEAKNAAGEYLLQVISSMQENSDSEKLDTIRIVFGELDLSINRNSEKNNRNSAYIRKLELSVNYMIGTESKIWSRSISDKLSNAELESLFDEEFPVEISGNYLEMQPSSLRITLLTLTTLALAAALYFIRT